MLTTFQNSCPPAEYPATPGKYSQLVGSADTDGRREQIVLDEENQHGTT
jgi:hypothetical protein